MADWNKTIIEWAENYLRYRDLAQNKIREMKPEKDRIVVLHKDGSREMVISAPDLPKLDPKAVSGPTIFVTLNKKENLKFLADNWKVLSAVKEISVIFINPDSQLDTKWIIRPFVHNRICDDSSLKLGLKSMFETVDEIV